MGDDDDGQTGAAVDVPEHVQNVRAGLYVHRAGGLVGQQQLRAIGQRDGDGDALLLAAGELIEAAVALVAQAHHLQ